MKTIYTVTELMADLPEELLDTNSLPKVFSNLESAKRYVTEYLLEDWQQYYKENNMSVSEKLSVTEKPGYISYCIVGSSNPDADEDISTEFKAVIQALPCYDSAKQAATTMVDYD